MSLYRRIRSIFGLRRSGRAIASPADLDQKKIVLLENSQKYVLQTKDLNVAQVVNREGRFSAAFKNLPTYRPAQIDPIVRLEKARFEELLGGPIAPVARHIATGWADGRFRLAQRKNFEARLAARDAAPIYMGWDTAEDRAAEQARRNRTRATYELLRRGYIVSDVASMTDSEVEEVLAIAEKYGINV
jgi:hypothetical protein